MRRTKASLIYRRTKNLRAVQLLLGHSKLESTVRYAGSTSCCLGARADLRQPCSYLSVRDWINAAPWVCDSFDEAHLLRF